MRALKATLHRGRIFARLLSKHEHCMPKSMLNDPSSTHFVILYNSHCSAQYHFACFWIDAVNVSYTVVRKHDEQRKECFVTTSYVSIPLKQGKFHLCESDHLMHDLFIATNWQPSIHRHLTLTQWALNHVSRVARYIWTGHRVTPIT